MESGGDMFLHIKWLLSEKMRKEVVDVIDDLGSGSSHSVFF